VIPAGTSANAIDAMTSKPRVAERVLRFIIFSPVKV